MAVNDPVADFLTRIRNAIRAQHRFVDLSWSRVLQELAELLKNQGFIENYLVKQESQCRGKMRLYLKYSQGRQPVIRGLQRVSKPGLRKYVGAEDIPQFFGGLGVPILSTSQGIMSGNEARKRHIGGELMCLVW